MTSIPDDLSRNTDNARNTDYQAREADVSAFSARMRSAAGERSLTQADLARRSGTKRQSMADYWNGKRLPSSDRLFPIADVLSVSARWLIYGTPETLSERLLNREDDWIWVPLHQLDDLINDTGDVVEDMVHIDQQWTKRLGCDVDNIWISPMPNDAIEDIAKRGELLVFEEVKRLVEGRYYAFSVDGIAVVRRFDIQPGKIILSGSNPGITPMAFNSDAIGRDVKTVGHLIGVYGLRAV